MLACVRRGLSVRQGNLQEGLGDYPDRSFDYVVLSQTLPFLDDPAMILAEMLRVGERAVVSFPNWGYWRCRLELLLTGRMPLRARPAAGLAREAALAGLHRHRFRALLPGEHASPSPARPT